MKDMFGIKGGGKTKNISYKDIQFYALQNRSSDSFNFDYNCEDNKMAGGASELEILQMKSNQVTDDSLESTRRMLQLVEESEDVGMKTLTMLNDQGEQLDRIEEDMDAIHSDMREAEKNLTGMEKCCGICICPCAKASEFNKDNNAWRSNEDGKVVNSQPQRVIDNRNGAGPAPGGYVQKITNDAREDEMEENMGQVSSIIGNLKNMAIDMGSEIDSQNSQVDRINKKAQSNETHIVNANERASKLLKN